MWTGQSEAHLVQRRTPTSLRTAIDLIIYDTQLGKGFKSELFLAGEPNEIALRTDWSDD